MGRTKPEVEPQMGPPPADLEIVDIIVGEGTEAVAGGNVEVHYLGVDYDTGEEFDSSWSRGDTIRFPLNNLIQAWRDGIPGMRVGGRRQLTCPPHLAYGPAGGGHPLAGKTLVFVIDLVSAD
jgi:peptidylprolyl isomerase